MDFILSFWLADDWESRWVESEHKGSDQGKWKWTAGKFYGDEDKDKGLQTSQDARFYGISTKFESFSNEGKSLVIQFTVKHEQNIDCGGGYVKVRLVTVYPLNVCTFSILTILISVVFNEWPDDLWLCTRDIYFSEYLVFYVVVFHCICFRYFRAI